MNETRPRKGQGISRCAELNSHLGDAFLDIDTCKGTITVVVALMPGFTKQEHSICDLLWRNREQAAKQMFLLLAVQYIA